MKSNKQEVEMMTMGEEVISKNLRKTVMVRYVDFKAIVREVTVVIAQVVMRAQILKTENQTGLFQKLEGLAVVDVVVLKYVTVLVTGVGQLVLVNVVIARKYVPGVE